MDEPLDSPVQLLAVLRGCLAAYLCGVLLLWADYVQSYLQTGRGLIPPWNMLVGYLLGGGLLAVPIAVLVLALWHVLARRRISVTYHWSLVSGVTGCLAIAGPTFIALAFGLALGGSFWLAAFGLKKKVPLTTQW